MSETYTPETISRDELNQLPGLVAVQFGTNWCGYCQAGGPAIDEALAGIDGVRRILVEDGKGRPLGRTFHVKLWPTVILLNNGAEVARVVRPWRVTDLAELVGAAQNIDS